MNVRGHLLRWFLRGLGALGALLVLGVLFLAFLLFPPRTQVGREFFRASRGIGVADPAPDKDGTWTMPIEYEASSPRRVVWEAEVERGRVRLRAFAVRTTRVHDWLRMPDSYGASLPGSLPEGKYDVVLINPDKTEVLLARVDARYSNDFGGERKWN
jgi:hypothetical protein